MKFPTDIFEYIKQQETAYQTEEIPITDNWAWNMRWHIDTSISFKHGKFIKGANDFSRPFKKIIPQILNVKYRARNIDVKDIILYVEGKEHLSFLIKKYHDDVFLKENDIDEFIDDVIEEESDLGGVLVQKTNDPKPEVLKLQSIAFCDQSDLLGGPIGFKHFFSPDSLRKKSKAGWGEEMNGATISIEDLIALAEPEKQVDERKGNKQTPGLWIEGYIVLGSLPVEWLTDKASTKDKYPYQLQIVAFYKDKEGNRNGQILYRKEADEDSIKFFTSQKVYRRGLGKGGAEELFDEQIWSNHDAILLKDLMVAASKVILQTNDSSYVNRNKIKDMENLQVTVVEDGKSIGVVPTVPVNAITLFEREIARKEQDARTLGSAQDPLLGVPSASGVPFRSQERQVIEGKGIHEYHRGKFAKFFEIVYRDWIIPKIALSIVNGKKFLASLTFEEMKFVSERMAESYANRTRNEQVLNGEIPTDKEALKQQYLEEFRKGGNKRWIEILKDEFRDVGIKVEINIAGKQKDLGLFADKITNIFRFVFSNPQGFMQVMQIPGMSGAFNEILEYSGLSPVDFAGLASMPMQQPMQPEQMQPEMQQMQPQMQ